MTSAKKPRLTRRVRRGLRWFTDQGWADYEAVRSDEDGGRSHGLDAKAKADIERAYAWLLSVAHEEPNQ